MNRHGVSRKQAFIAAAILATAAAVAGCGGGGGSSLTGATNAQSGAPGSTSNAQGKATFSLTIPSTSTASNARSAQYVSPNAQSISIAVTNNGTAGTPVIANLTSGSPNCTTGTSGLTCTITVAAPIGSDSFVVDLYAGQNGTGNVLSSATVAGTVVAQQGNTIPITLGGNVASIAISVTNGNSLIPGGYATSLPVVVTAKDPSGATIVGPGNYSNPITLTNADTSGITTLSTTTVNAPSTAVTLTYGPNNTNGGILAINGLPIGSTQIGASASGVATSSVTPGTFQYDGGRFSGYNHVRQLSGTATVVVTSYNGSGTPSPNPSSYAYNVSEPSIGLAGASFNGGTYTDNQFTEVFTQTSPLPAPSPETQIVDRYRKQTLNSTGSVDYQYAVVTNDTNYATINSPFDGFVPGTTTETETWPSGYEIGLLPLAAANWANQTAPYTIAWTGSEVGSWNYPGDGSYTFSETAPTTLTQAEAAVGTGTSFNGSVLTTYSLPSGNVIPVRQEVTSPAPGPTSLYAPANWYANGVVASPLYTDTYQVQAISSIPTGAGQCVGLAASLASMPAFVLTETRTELRVPNFQLRQQINNSVFIYGIGDVCNTYTGTFTNYNNHTGIIAGQTVQQEITAVTSTSGLSVKRQP